MKNFAPYLQRIALNYYNTGHDVIQLESQNNIIRSEFLTGSMRMDKAYIEINEAFLSVKYITLRTKVKRQYPLV